jgi:two-component system LytT family response regulator
MTISAFVIDDEPYAIEVLSDYIQRTAGMKLAGFNTDPLQALAALANQAPPDIIFADIDMPGLNGLELAAALPAHSVLVYTTSFREYAAEAYENSAADYLLKPIAYPRFQQSLKKVRELLAGRRFGPEHQQEDGRFIKTGTKGFLQKVHLSGISYFEAAQNFVLVHQADSQTITYLSLSDVGQQLPVGMFVRLHRSFLVNLKHITAVEAGQVRLTTGKRLPIGRAYRDLFLQAIAGRVLVPHRGL